MNIRTFLIEPTEHVQFAVVRVSHARLCELHPTVPCYARWVAFEGHEKDDRIEHLNKTVWTNAAIWPSKCDRCGTSFTHEDTISTGTSTIYSNAAAIVRAIDWRSIGPAEWSGLLSDAPAGAMWWATWMDDFMHHQLEHALVVKTPGGDWMPDERAANCTMPQDNEHFCWVLHGPLENVTVDKNGKTCGAGAGSIAQPGYHGFLRNGELVRA
jgi:hypothetical protein